VASGKIIVGGFVSGHDLRGISFSPLAWVSVKSNGYESAISNPHSAIEDYGF
jgi:hypothetical protein